MNWQKQIQNEFPHFTYPDKYNFWEGPYLRLVKLQELTMNSILWKIDCFLPSRSAPTCLCLDEGSVPEECEEAVLMCFIYSSIYTDKKFSIAVDGTFYSKLLVDEINRLDKLTGRKEKIGIHMVSLTLEKPMSKSFLTIGLCDDSESEESKKLNCEHLIFITSLK